MKVLCNVVWEKVGDGNSGRESAEEELGGGVGGLLVLSSILVDWGLTKKKFVSW